MNNHTAFLAFIMKYLVTEMGEAKIDKAWKYVCADRYCSQRKLELTGNHSIGIWYDLGNTAKILTDSSGKNFFVQGSCWNTPYPFTKLFPIYYSPDKEEASCTGWIVCDV